MPMRWASTPFFRLFIVSLITYTILAYMLPIFFYPDSEQYVRTAKAIMKQENGEFYYYRTWGYPLFMTLMGITTHETFYALLVVQLLFAALIPPLVYATVANIYPRVAVYAAAIVLISFSPAFFSNFIMSDQISMFLRFYLIYLASRCIFGSTSNSLLFILVTSGFVLYLMRPADACTFIIIPVCLLLFQVSNWRKLIAAILIFVLAVFAFNKFRDVSALKYTRKHHINSSSVVGSMTGRMLFFNVYAVGPKLIARSTINIQNGKYSMKLVNNLIDWGRANPLGVNSYTIQGAQMYPSVYAGVDTPEKFAKALIAEEGLFAHSVMWLALDQLVGGYKADRIFLGAALESYMANPKTLLLLYDGMVEFFFAGDVVYNNGIKATWNTPAALFSLTRMQSITTNPSFSKSLKNELQNKDALTPANLIIVALFLFFWITGIKIISTILALACLPATFVVSRKLSCMASIIVLMLLYHAAVAVVFASPHYRYSFPHVPLIVILAALGMASFGFLHRQAVNRSVFPLN